MAVGRAPEGAEARETAAAERARWAAPGVEGPAAVERAAAEGVRVRAAPDWEVEGLEA